VPPETIGGAEAMMRLSAASERGASCTALSGLRFLGNGLSFATV
jgi:hypothetical protein